MLPSIFQLTASVKEHASAFPLVLCFLSLIHLFLCDIQWSYSSYLSVVCRAHLSTTHSPYSSHTKSFLTLPHLHSSHLPLSC